MDDVQVLCDLEIDMAETRSTWQQVKSLLADCLQSNSNPPRPIPDGKGPGKTKSALRLWYLDVTR